MRKLKKIAVLMGGSSSESEVSRRSGRAVASGLRAAGYATLEIDVAGWNIEQLPGDIDAIFVALHGEFGEDGKIQALLSSRGIPYTGSGPQASEAAFDKRISKKLFMDSGVPTPSYQVLRAGEPRTVALPAVIKPPRQGSSIGVHRVFTEEEWGPAFAEALKYDSELIVEEYIPGRELTVGVVDQTAFPVVEILAPDGWYDYKAKYTPGFTRYVVPAEIDADIVSRCHQLALLTFQVLGCRGFGRVDFRLNEKNELYVLELNNIPGFTETSLLPKAAQAAGVGFSELCDRIVRLATVSP